MGGSFPWLAWFDKTLDFVQSRSILLMLILLTIALQYHMVNRVGCSWLDWYMGLLVSLRLVEKDYFWSCTFVVRGSVNEAMSPNIPEENKRQ